MKKMLFDKSINKKNKNILISKKISRINTKKLSNTIKLEKNFVEKLYYIDFYECRIKAYDS